VVAIGYRHRREPLGAGSNHRLALIGNDISRDARGGHLLHFLGDRAFFKPENCVFELPLAIE
jgi:hypothetical protein